MDTMVILGLFGFVFHNDFLLGNTAFGESTGMRFFSGGVVISGKPKHEISDKPWRTKVMDCCFFCTRTGTPVFVSNIGFCENHLMVI